VVLDRVVSAALKYFGNLSPFIIDDAVHKEQNPFLLFAPINLFDARVQMIVPSFTALFAHAAVQVLRDESPLLWPISDDELEDSPVLLGRPSALDIERLALSPHTFLGQKRGSA